LTATQCATIGGNLETGRGVVGAYEDDRQRIETCRLTLEQSRTQAESLLRRVSTEEKRLDRASRTLRIPLDFSVGRIVQHQEGRVRVDLDSFYESLQGRTDTQLELALGEFFAKGILGVITRANRKYLINFPAREKVFMQLARSLRELFEAVLERDRLQRRVEWITGRLEHLVEALHDHCCAVDVGGAIAGETAMEFILSRVVKKPEDGGYDFFHKTARLELHCGGGAVEIVSCGTDGARSSTKVTASEMEGLRFAVDDDRILWEPVSEAVGV
jgi:FAD/FMN-containing dehydrogenase